MWLITRVFPACNTSLAEHCEHDACLQLHNNSKYLLGEITSTVYPHGSSVQARRTVDIHVWYGEVRGDNTGDLRWHGPPIEGLGR